MRPQVFLILLSLVSFSCRSGQASLCAAQEESIFWCNARTERHEICASSDLGATTGYMQYRAGSKGRIALASPAGKRGPLGVFELELLAKGTRLSFRHGEVSYEIYQPLADRASIVTTRGQRSVTTQCVSDSDTLSLTSTMRRFQALGIYK